LVLFVDLPLSFVADTLTMPLAIYEWQRGDAPIETAKPAGDTKEGTTAPAASHPDHGP
jgi:hypothetical protein